MGSGEKEKMRKKRQRELEITENYENYIDQSTSEQILQQQDDQELYMVDRIGSKNSRKKIQKNESIKENMNNILSKVEMKLIQKKLKSSNSSTKQNNTKNTINDIWEEDEIENNKNNKKRNQIHQTKALKIPIAGISYNPSHIDHQDAVAEVITRSSIF